jgi:hypothetical protein
MPFIFTLFFLVKQQIIRHEMKESLEKEFLHTIAIPKDGVMWVKYNKEIRVENKLFDVESFSEKGDMYIFEGLFDEEETALNNLLEQNTQTENENELAQLFHMLQSLCTDLSSDQSIITNTSNNFGFPILLNISSPFIGLLTPPPQV